MAFGILFIERLCLSLLFSVFRHSGFNHGLSLSCLISLIIIHPFHVGRCGFPLCCVELDEKEEEEEEEKDTMGIEDE
ncbi:Uncharacterized protein TCM_009743 [Theobroma cacao]|uniref:Uncharacterized protein n=1 Tax=Theobroma cacao TaxID=3641 RepID=A0A061E596_THECC|nr:Uncharacterized protein TCM_009743 [Theobroma cacao]